MSNTTPQTLHFLKQMADDAVEAAMQSLARALQSVEQAQQQADMLAQYQQEYRQQWQSATQQGMKADVYRNFQHFFSQLETAVHGQNQQLEKLAAVVAQQRVHLQDAQRTQNAYAVLIARAEHRQQLVARKRDQKMMDEFASRAKRINPSAAGG